MSTRSQPTILCQTCGKRRLLKGSLRSRHTGARFCAACVKAETRKRAGERP